MEEMYNHILFMKASIPFDISNEGGMYKVHLGKGIGLAIDSEIKDIARSIGGTVFSEGGYSFGSFDNKSTAETFANRVREELDKRNGIRIDRKVYDALLLKLRNAGVNVCNNIELMAKILDNVTPSDIKLLPIDRNSEEYRKIVSDASVRIENRLAELRRSIAEVQSSKSDYGNYAERSAAADYSPETSGVHSAGTSAAKIWNYFQSSKDLAEKIIAFIEKIEKTDCFDDLKDNFSENLLYSLGLTPTEGETSQYVPIKFNDIKERLRVSNHEGNAMSLIIKGKKVDKGFSVVVKTINSPEEKFKSNIHANVKEFVYDNPSRERLSRVVKSIFGLLEYGEYIDIAVADSVNVSPKPLGYKDGEYYGFVHDNTIYIDPTRVNAETPIHEYAHLWAEALRQQNPKEWNHIVSIMKEDISLWNYVKSNYSHLQSDNDIADEVLATYSGRQGLERLKEASKKYDNPKSMFEYITKMLETYWTAVCGLIGVEYENKEEVADRILYDFLNEVNPLDYTKNGVQKLSDRMILGQKITKTVGDGIQKASKTMNESLTQNEKQMISQVATDLVTGNHLLGRSQPDGYKELMREVGNAFAAVKSFSVTSRQRDILSELIENYRDGYEEVASQIGVDVPLLKAALSNDNTAHEKYVNVLRQQVKQAIRDRIVHPYAHFFSPDQVEILNRYHQVATPDTPANETFSRLLHEVAQEADVARKPEKWVTDTAKELNDLADGIIREESRGLHK